MEPDLNDMRLFVEVAKAKNFRRAAEIIGIPNPTLSRRIAVLEKTIGLRLLHRTTRKVELTEAGRIYYERCRRIVDEARLAHEQLGEMLDQPSGLLRVSLPVDFALTYLAPLIVEFAGRYPGIMFDFDLTPRKVDLVSEPYDVAIRTGNLENSQLIGRCLAQLPAHLYASPRYLERAGHPTSPTDLTQHECLGILGATSWTLHNSDKTVIVTFGGGRFVLNNIGMLRRLASLEMGIVLIPDQLAVDDVATGHLLQVLPEWRGDHVPVYALTETRLLPAKTHLFIEFISKKLNNKIKNI